MNTAIDKLYSDEIRQVAKDYEENQEAAKEHTIQTLFELLEDLGMVETVEAARRVLG